MAAKKQTPSQRRKVKRCAEKVKATGKSKASAFRICNAAQTKKKSK